MPADEKEGVRTTQMFEIYIKSPPETVWDAITKPEWTTKYGYQGVAEYQLRVGGAVRQHATAQMKSYGLPDVIIDGEILELNEPTKVEAKPPYRLVHTYRFLFSEEQKAEGFTRITWEIDPCPGGFSRLTVIHELEGAPITARMVATKFSEDGGGGWAWVLSDLKSLLETGKRLSDS
jgi:uncharacterized protein YndB with AHSA1/START domain